MGVYADAVDKFMIPLMNRTKGWQLDDLDGFSLPFYNSPGMQVFFFCEGSQRVFLVDFCLFLIFFL